jgi:hypothetical protein
VAETAIGKTVIVKIWRNKQFKELKVLIEELNDFNKNISEGSNIVELDIIFGFCSQS